MTPTERVDLIARVAHEANRGYQAGVPTEGIPPLMLAAQLGRCAVESMTEEDATDEPEPVGLFG